MRAVGSERRFALLVALGGCSMPERQESWTDQLSPSGPCWEVNLGDGLDEESTGELHALYACLNKGGNLDAFAEVDETMDATSRAGVPLGIEAAVLINALPDQEVDPFAFADAALALMEADDRPIEPLIEIAVEMMYGRAYTVVESSVDLQSESELDRGVVRPILPVVAIAARTMLDDGDAIPTLLADALESDAVADVACTAVGIAESDDAGVVALSERLLPDLGTAIARSRDFSNDRWSGASGDSLRDMIEASSVTTGDDGLTATAAMSDDLVTVLASSTLRDRVETALVKAVTDDHLDPLPPEMLYLASVDTWGGPLESDEEDTALLASLRLLHDGNTEVVCSLDLWITNLEVNLGNLSVELLRMMAQQDPETAVGGIALLGDIIGSDLTEALMYEIAASGVCPAIDEQLVDDLHSIDRLTEPQVGELLVVLLDVLSAFYGEGTDDYIPELVDLASAAYARGLAHPTEEVLYDLGSSALLADVMDALPLVLDPDPLETASCPTDSQPLDFDAAWALGAKALAPDGTGSAPVDTFESLMIAVLAQEGTWTAVGNLGALARDDDARFQEMLSLVPPFIAADPEMELPGQMAALLRSPELVEPALRIAESHEMTDALGRSELTREGPLPFVARLIVGGTLEAVLRTVDLLLVTVDGIEDEPSEPE